MQRSGIQPGDVDAAFDRPRVDCTVYWLANPAVAKASSAEGRGVKGRRFGSPDTAT